MTDDDLPTSIGRPALGALRAAGIDRLSEVARYPERELLALHGVGPKAVRLLRAELAGRGLELPPGLIGAQPALRGLTSTRRADGLTTLGHRPPSPAVHALSPRGSRCSACTADQRRAMPARPDVERER